MDVAYRSALTMIHTGHGDPMAAIEQALRTDPDFVSYHCLRAALLVCKAPMLAFSASRATIRRRRPCATCGIWPDAAAKAGRSAT